MALVDATRSQIDYTSLTAFETLVEADATVFSWLTPDPHHVVSALGAGFTYSGSTPTGGTVDTVVFDLIDDDHPYGFSDVTISGLAVPLTGLVDLANPAAGQVTFWETLLAGNDTILAPLLAGGRLFGDFLDVHAALQVVQRTGGDDTFVAESPVQTGGTGVRVVLDRGGSGSQHALIGDAVGVSGSTFGSFIWEAYLQGGNDTFQVSRKSAFTVIGDVQTVGLYGIVTGGNDAITSSIDIISVTEGRRLVGYVGDAEINFGQVTGGRDTIRGSNFAFVDEAIIGDVIENGSTDAPGFLTGGNDLLFGRAGQEMIAGDVFRMQGGAMTGGADRIQGGQDSDIISGDMFQSIGLQFILPIGGGPGTQVTTTVSVAGGDDRLSGDDGDDWIVGDLWNGDGIAEPSTITGGDDTIFGGTGDDMLYGDIGADFIGLLDAGGDDVLDGGEGNDILDGQLGIDTASFASLALAVTVDLQAGTATGQGDDLLFGIENITGSTRADTLLGDAGANAIDGGRGNDVINGRAGNDTLTDGEGRDSVSGGQGLDTFMLAADGNADTFDGGNDVDAINLAAATSNVTVTFTGSGGAGTISGGGFGADTFASIEFVAGSDKASLVDTVIGAGGTQVMFLRRGNDIASGGGGDDLMAGEGGNDRLDGGAGNDGMNGGTGADTFVFSTTLNAASNVDEIEDFDTTADRIELSSAIFTGLAPGKLANAGFVAGAGLTSAQDASDRIVYDTTTGDVYFDRDGAGGAAAVKFATLTGAPSLVAGDFFVV